MAGRGNYYGYGSKAAYVRYFAERGFSIAEIARTLGTTIVKLMAECRELDFYKYQIFARATAGAWTNDEIKIVADNISDHGPDWVGWGELLPDRSASAIKGCAVRLGIYRRW